ncbi:unnamed protein product [Paramecium primaurelia]|uniref:Uncharacterized protein n=1 Tax=Paramecium primaurelia TaxID=5886 RepID=A0A8S1KQF7_PARPR|nr:unnamed protein product [Paramecium primaurelia]
MNSFQFNQLIPNQQLLIKYYHMHPFQLKYNQLQMEQMQLQYMTNILRIMQYFHYFNHNFQIQVAQLTNLLILIYQIQQVTIFAQLIPKTFSNYQSLRFYQKNNLSQDSMIDFTIINVYYNFQSYPQCDQIKLVYIKLSNYQSDLMIGQLMVCEGKIIKVSGSCPFKPCQPIQKYLTITNLQYINQLMNSVFIANKQQINFTFSNQLKKFLTSF